MSEKNEKISDYKSDENISVISKFDVGLLFVAMLRCIAGVLTAYGNHIRIGGWGNPGMK